MEPLSSPEGESFLISGTSKGSPDLVLAPGNPTKSVRTNIVSIAEQQDLSFRTIDNFNSPEIDLASISAGTDDSNRAIKSPRSTRRASTERPTDTFSSDHTDTARRNEPSHQEPFIPGFLRLTSDSHIPQDAIGGPTSFFDDSDSDADQDGVIVEAIRGHLNRRQLVEHRSPSGVKPAGKPQLPAIAREFDDRPRPSRTKVERLLGTHVTDLSDLEPAGESHLPRTTQAPPTVSQGLSQTAADVNDIDDSTGLGIWIPSEEDSLTQKPFQRSVLASPKRRVTFPPPPLDIQPGHRFLRQSIISTPYPRPQRDKKNKSSSSSGKIRDSVMTLCLYSNNSPLPKISRIVVPADRNSGLVTDSAEKRGHDSKTDFDDEKFFRLIRTEYRKMRSSFHRLGSFRVLQSFNLSSYKDLSQHASRWQKLAHTKNFSVVDEDFDQEKMLRLYRQPQLARGEHEWVDWVLNLPGRLNGGHDSVENENIVMEFVEGWCFVRIAASIALVVLLSVVTALLWILVGVGGEMARSTNAGWRNAGGRVEGGVAMGVFGLLLGWTGIGAWVTMSWLVM
ncbi:hypothetical protein MMC16_003958 [Acarospora aff. strigata]|nr:hypothetical protein [Acarospora aff. strigata]